MMKTLYVVLLCAVSIPSVSAGTYDEHVSNGVRELRNSHTDNAIAQFKEACSHDSNKFEAYAYLGNAYLIAGHLDEAQRSLKQAIELCPDSPECHFLLGRLFRVKDDPLSALKEFEKTVEISPQSLTGRKAAAEIRTIKTESSRDNLVVK